MRRVVSVFRTVLGNPELRRVELAFAGFNGAEYAVWISMLVYAYEQGGATTAGVVALAQLVPATLLAPLAGVLSDRFPAARVQAAGYLLQAAGMGATALSLLLGGPPVLSYGCAAIAATAVTITRPTQAVLVPAVARTPDELTAVNVISGWIESAAIFVAPALAGVLLGVSSPGVVFAVFAVVAIVAALLVAPLAARSRRLPAHATALATDARAEIAAGFRTLRTHPHARLLVAFLALQYFLIGGLDVLAVVLAIDVLHRGDAWAGYLNAAFGAGGVAATMGTVALVGRRRLAPVLVGATMLCGTAFAALSYRPTAAGALVLLALTGAGRIGIDVSGRTLLQRIAPPEVLSRVFGVLEGLTMLMLAIGSILVPIVVAVAGAPWAFVVVGLVLPLLALVRLRVLVRLDAAATVPIVEIALLRSLRIFAPLPPPALEGLARALDPVVAPAGTVVIREGDLGDRFYAIADGEVAVTCGGLNVTRLGRGDHFGEIALLRTGPRTATVTAVRDTRLYALEKGPFVVALTGHAPVSTAVADAIVRERSEQLAALVRRPPVP